MNILSHAPATTITIPTIAPLAFWQQPPAAPRVDFATQMAHPRAVQDAFPPARRQLIERSATTTSGPGPPLAYAHFRNASVPNNSYEVLAGLGRPTDFGRQGPSEGLFTGGDVVLAPALRHQSGDWTCAATHCSRHNFARNLLCSGCGTQRPTSIPSPTRGLGPVGRSDNLSGAQPHVALLQYLGHPLPPMIITDQEQLLNLSGIDRKTGYARVAFLPVVVYLSEGDVLDPVVIARERGLTCPDNGRVAPKMFWDHMHRLEREDIAIQDWTRPGDWICAHCGHENHGHKDICNGCCRDSAGKQVDKPARQRREEAHNMSTHKALAIDALQQYVAEEGQFTHILLLSGGVVPAEAGGKERTQSRIPIRAIKFEPSHPPPAPAQRALSPAAAPWIPRPKPTSEAMALSTSDPLPATRNPLHTRTMSAPGPDTAQWTAAARQLYTQPPLAGTASAALGVPFRTQSFGVIGGERGGSPVARTAPLWNSQVLHPGAVESISPCNSPVSHPANLPPLCTSTLSSHSGGSSPRASPTVTTFPFVVPASNSPFLSTRSESPFQFPFDDELCRASAAPIAFCMPPC